MLSFLWGDDAATVDVERASDNADKEKEEEPRVTPPESVLAKSFTEEGDLAEAAASNSTNLSEEGEPPATEAPEAAAAASEDSEDESAEGFLREVVTAPIRAPIATPFKLGSKVEVAFSIRGERITYPATVMSIVRGAEGPEYCVRLSDGGLVPSIAAANLRLLEEESPRSLPAQLSEAEIPEIVAEEESAPPKRRLFGILRFLKKRAKRKGGHFADNRHGPADLFPRSVEDTDAADVIFSSGPSLEDLPHISIDFDDTPSPAEAGAPPAAP